MSLLSPEEFDEQAMPHDISPPDDPDEAELAQLLTLSCLPPEEFDKQAALLNEPAPDDDELGLALSLSRLSLEAFDEQIARMNLAEAEPNSQYASVTSQASARMYHPTSPYF